MRASVRREVGGCCFHRRSVESGRVELGSSAARHGDTADRISVALKNSLVPLLLLRTRTRLFIRRRRGLRRRAGDDGPGRSVQSGRIQTHHRRVLGRRIMRFFAAGQKRMNAHTRQSSEHFSTREWHGKKKKKIEKPTIVRKNSRVAADYRFGVDDEVWPGTSVEWDTGWGQRRTACRRILNASERVHPVFI